MATKVKTTVTFTFTFESESEERAISSLRNWFSDHRDETVRLVKNADTKEYIYLMTEHYIGDTFKFNTPAEFITKFSKVDGPSAPCLSMLDYARVEDVTAKTETIDVEEEK